MLDVAEKLSERIISNRLVHHLSWNDLHKEQYKFRKSSSIVDAISFVQAFSEFYLKESRIIVCVELDIIIAFNFLPYNRLWETLETYRIPIFHLFEGHHAELSSRQNFDQMDVNKEEDCPGEFHRSILNPLLWNLVFNRILPFLPIMTYYTNDT